MRILHIVTAFPRFPNDIISPWLVEMLKRLRAAGYDVEVLAPAYRGGGNREFGGIPVHRFRYFPARWEDLTHDQATLDRLGRSLQDLVGFLGEIRGAGVDLYLHKQAIDTSTPAGKALVPDDRRVQRIRGRHDPRADPRRAEPGSCRGKALGSDHRSTPLGPPRFAKLSPTSGGAMPYSTQSNSAASSARMNACVPVRRSSHKNRPS